MNPSPSVTESEEQRYAELQAAALEAARAGNGPLLAAMLQAGMPANLSDPKGNSLLMLASYHGHAEMVRMLLAHKADPERRNRRGQTPLGGAAFKGDVAIVRLLLDAGADPSADNGMGLTPIRAAALFGRTGALDLLQSRRKLSARARAARAGARLSSRLQQWSRALFPTRSLPAL